MRTQRRHLTQDSGVGRISPEEVRASFESGRGRHQGAAGVGGEVVGGTVSAGGTSAWSRRVRMSNSW